MKHSLFLLILTILIFNTSYSQTSTMKILKINNGKAELRTVTGSFIRTIADHVVAAELNTDQTLILVTTSQGKVELRKESGSFIRTITDHATNAKFVGADIVITKDNRKMELRKESGSFIRNL